MTYDECMDLLDFLNWRMRKFRNPSYTWAIEHTWEKYKRWAKHLGYAPFKWRPKTGAYK